MSCSHDYPDPIDRRAGRTSIGDQYVGIIVDEVAGVNEPVAHGRYQASPYTGLYIDVIFQ